MFGCTPGCCKKFSGACAIACGYSLEEYNKWTVVEKNGYFIPCRIDDLEMACADGHIQRRVLYSNGEYVDFKLGE